MILTIIDCSRCGGIHENLTFRAFQLPPPVATHWATCSKTGDPILMILAEDPARYPDPKNGSEGHHEAAGGPGEPISP